MKKSTRNTTLALAVGSAFGLALSAAHADGNPFAMQTLDRGYMVAEAGDKMKDGKCGGEMKTKEGKCGNMEKPAADTKMKDGKCGEGKCGASMDKPAKAKSSKKAKAAADKPAEKAPADAPAK